MKKKALVSSILTIALCLSLIAGSTFALFTDSKTVNIAVTSGDVEVAAKMDSFALYSAQGPVGEHSDKYLKDEHGAYYEHINPNTGYFINGGYVENDGANLEIFKITPGDRVDININVKNTGDVAMRYRYIVKIAEDDSKTLSRGMVLTTHAGKDYESFKSFTSEWFSTVHPTEERNHLISLELPVYANDDYQTEYGDGVVGGGDSIKNAKYTITVQAVQSNAVTTEQETFVEVYPSQKILQDTIQTGGTIDLKNIPAYTEEGFLIKNAPTGFANGTLSATYANGDYCMLSNNFDPTGAPAANIDFVLENAVLETTVANQIVMLLFEGTGHKVTVDAESKIKATGAKSACVQIAATDCELYLESAASLVATNGALAFVVNHSGTTLKIFVPDSEVAAITALVNNAALTHKDADAHIFVNGVEIAAGVQIG